MPSDQKLFCITEQQLEEMQDGIDMQKMSAYDKCNEDIKTTGLMYYKLEAGTYSSIRKMILIK